MFLELALFLFLSGLTLDKSSASDSALLVVTIATDETDGYKQFMQSALKNGLKTETFGLGGRWIGGDMEHSPGGGQKVNLLKQGLEKYKNNKDLIILFSDSYDAIIVSKEADILRKYQATKAGVVFSAEEYIWPDKSLAAQYPEVSHNEKRFLNSGGMIGRASDIYAIVSHHSIGDNDDDQLYYTQIFLDPSLREKWNIVLDTKSEIFQALNGALADVELKFKSRSSYLYNSVTGTTPSVIHGNGPIKPEFYRIANYLMGAWTPVSGCILCKDNTISLAASKIEDYPLIMVAIFIEKPTPFLLEFFQLIGNLTFPKSRIDLYIHNAVQYHEGQVTQFVEDNTSSYSSVSIVNHDSSLDESDARNKAIELCIRKSCKYLFMVDSIAHLTNENVLNSLIEQNRSILAPMLKRPREMWSNFWGGLNSDGFYLRSKDYMEIIESNRVGVWNVPYISQAFIIHAAVLPKIVGSFKKGTMDPDMAFCHHLRGKGHFMHVTNRENFGHLIQNDKFDTSHLHNELYEIFSNPYNWEKRYIHPEFFDISQPGTPIPQPCPDVYLLHVLTPQFCWDLIEETENYGIWSGGKHEDKRLSGGYENVPTDDIHLNQLGLDQQWLQFLKMYVQPLQKKIFIGYHHDPPQSHMNFVVRYTTSAQPYLRPHHDSSTYSINVALNRRGIDFQGGGTNFLRYNCSVTTAEQGWVLMHPGKLTHYHEGLHTTEGTRYIMVSFVDP